MSKDFDADRYITKRWPYGDQSIRYVNATTGNDANDGLTPATAWQTLDKGLSSFAIAAVDKSWVLDLTGTFTITNTLNLGGTMLAGLNYDLDLAATGPSNFISKSSCQLRATPTAVVTPIGITGSSTQATTGLYTINVSNVLVAGAHAGQMLLGAGLAEWARIIDNGVGSITVATTTNPSTWTAPVGIYTEGATISAGDAANFFEGATYLVALCDWAFTGIAFTSNAGAKFAALEVIANAPIYFTQCSFDGLYMRGGPGYVTFDACDFYSSGGGGAQGYNHDGSTVIVRQSTFRDLEFLCHGSSDSGNNSFIQCGFIDGLLPFGGGNVESQFSFSMNQCFFDGFASDAIHALFGNSRIQNTRIENTTGDAIQTENCLLTVTNVDGTTGNTAYGIRILNGAQVNVDAGTSVTGASGDILLGDAGAIAYAAVPAVDLGQLVRVF